MSLNAWSCFVGGLQLNVSLSPSFSYEVLRLNADRSNGAVWLTNGDAALHWGGIGGPWASVSDGGLHVLSATPSSDEDAILGHTTSLAIAWSAPVGAPSWTTTFTCAASWDALLFTQAFPVGADNSSTPNSGIFDGFALAGGASAHFPAWPLGPAAPASALAHIQWAGEFAWHQQNWNVSFEGYVSGQMGGPTVLHEPTWPSGGKPRAAVAAAVDAFKDAVAAIVPSPAARGGFDWVFGPHGNLVALPAGFSMTTALVAPSGGGGARPVFAAGDTGITAAVYQFGALLRAMHNTSRFAPEDDVGVAALSQYTDNGMVYDGDHWALPGFSGTGGNFVSSLASWAASAGVPLASLQLDPFWFAYETDIKNWTASFAVWGASGWAEALAETALPLTLYSFMWGPTPNTFSVAGVAMLDSPPWPNFMHGPFSRAADYAGATALYDELFRRCVAWGCAGFEIDFLDMQYLGFAQVAGEFARFLSGLSDAAAAAGVPVQLCMALASDVLASAALPAVSNIRASDDNDYTYAGPDRWRIGLSSLLHGALSVAPFFDGTWTVASYAPADAAGVPYPAGYAQNATELAVAISVLSAGPVGIGDKVGFANASLARLACAANGVLLKPSLPASPIDAMWRYSAGATAPAPPLMRVGGSEVWAAPAFIPISVANGSDAGAAVAAATAAAAEARGGLARFLQRRRGSSGRPRARPQPASGPPPVTPCPFFSVLAVDVEAALEFALLPGDLTPSLGAGSACSSAALSISYVILPWSPGIAHLTARCTDGARALDCIMPWSAEGLPIATGVAPDNGQFRPGGAHPFELLSLAPVLPGGWALLGQLDAFVRASPVRFSAVVAALQPPPAPSGIAVVVEGAPSETLQVLFLAPGVVPGLATATLRAVNVTFPPAGGSVLIRCEGAGSGGVCAQQAL